MNTAQNVTVFDDADMIRDCITMLCRDRLPKVSVEDPRDRKVREDAISKFCWDVFSLQGKTFAFSMLVDKCSALILRSNYDPIKMIRPQDLAHEICSPAGGW